MNTDSHRKLFRPTAIAAAALLAAAGLYAAVDTDSNSRSPHALSLKRDEQAVNRGSLEAASYADVVKRVAPSIVKITVEIKPHRASFGRGDDGQEFPGLNDPFFRQFFGNRIPMVPETPETGLGSGVIVSSDGYIVTNNHVVDGAKEVTVTLHNGRELKARVVGRDPQTDVAVVKVSASDLPAITFADSHKVEVGDRVLAIGNPFGIGETVTQGIVSATGRRAGIGLAYEDFIQTDAAINPGNSGGALVDVDGRLVGINTAILSRSGGFQGVGLAVPSDLVDNVAENLVAHGKVVRGYLGVGIQDLTPTLADQFGIKTNAGALVTDVRTGSPGAKAGLKSGDVITAFNGQPVDNASALSLSVGETAPGTRIALDVMRDGRTEHFDVTTATKPSGNNNGNDENALSQSGTDEGVLNGVGVADIDSSARHEINLPDRINGALITSVDPNSASARAGIREGDVIMEIDRHPVSSAQEAVDLSAKATSKKTLLKLWSHGNTVYVVIDESGSDNSGSE